MVKLLFLLGCKYDFVFKFILSNSQVLMYSIIFFRQLSAWMEMVAKFEVDQQPLKEIPISIHRLLVMPVIYGKDQIN